MHKIAWATSKRCAYGKLDIIYANDRKEMSTISHENHRNINILIQILEEFYACLMIIYLKRNIGIIIFWWKYIWTYLPKANFWGIRLNFTSNMCCFSFSNSIDLNPFGRADGRNWKK